MSEAVEVSAALGDDPLRFRACWASWIYTSMGRDLPAASRTADRLVALAERLRADELRLQAHHARWTTAFHQGQVTVARDDVEKGLSIYDFESHSDHWSMYGAHDPGVCARGTGACVLWLAGLAERAGVLAHDGVHLGDQLGHPFSRALGRWYAAFYCIMVGDADAATAYGKATAEIAVEASLAWPLNLARFIAGWALAKQGDLPGGIRRMAEMFQQLREANQHAYLPFFGTLVADAMLSTGAAQQTLRFLDDLEHLATTTHHQAFLPDLHRLRAEAFKHHDRNDARIEPELRLGLRVAQEQGAVALELRAAAGLATWLGEHHRRRDGEAVLSPAYRKIQEGLQTPDVRAARSLLEALA